MGDGGRGILSCAMIAILVLLVSRPAQTYRRFILNVEDLGILKVLMGEGTGAGTGGSSFMRALLELHQKHYDSAISLFLKADQSRLVVRYYLAHANGMIGVVQSDVDCGNFRNAGERALSAAILCEQLRSLPKEKQDVLREKAQGRCPEAMLFFAGYFLRKQLFYPAATWARLSSVYDTSQEAKITAGSGYFYAGMMEEAQHCFAAAYKLRPDSVSAYWYGRTLDSAGKSQLAIPLLEEAAAKAPIGFLSWCLRELGIAYSHVGRNADAAATFDRALSVDRSAANVERIVAARSMLGRAIGVGK